MADTPNGPRTPWEEKLEQRRQHHRDKIARRMARWEERRARWEARSAQNTTFRSGFGGAFIGLILAGIGVLLLLQNLGIIVVEDLWDYWPVILIVLGLLKVFSAWGTVGRMWGGLIAVIGGVFLLRNLGILPHNIWSLFWPAILIAVGLGLLLRAFDPGSGWAARSWHPPGALTDESTLHAVKIDAIFSHADRRFDTQQFEGGEINAIFGGVEVDLRKAAMKADQVHIECNAVFGGIDVKVPETWLVIMRGTGVFGGFADETHPPPRSDTKSPMLVITGGAVFGGVTVKN